MAALRKATGVMLLFAGCATGGTPAASTSAAPATPPPVTAAPVRPPAAAPTATAPRVPTHPIPFPPGTFAGEVASLAPPTVTARGDLWSIGFSLSGSAPAECLLGRRDLGTRGSIPELADANRSGFRLRGRSPTEVATRPPLPALFLTIQRPLGAVKVTAYRRGPEFALVCLQPGPAPPAAFEDVVAALATSLRFAAPTPTPTEEVWHCIVNVDNGGGTGWERTARTDTDGATTLRTTAALAYQDGETVELLEIDQREQTDARGRLASLVSLRRVDGVTDLHTQLMHVGGASYRYDVTFLGGHVEGTFVSTDPEGMLGTLAFTERIKSELLTGRTPELKLEVYDPFESPDTPTVKRYRPELPGGRRLLVTTGARASRMLVDANGYARETEYELHGGDMLRQTCAPERPRR